MYEHDLISLHSCADFDWPVGFRDLAGADDDQGHRDDDASRDTGAVALCDFYQHES